MPYFSSCVLGWGLVVLFLLNSEGLHHGYCPLPWMHDLGSLVLPCDILLGLGFLVWGWVGGGGRYSARPPTPPRSWYNLRTGIAYAKG